MSCVITAIFLLGISYFYIQPLDAKPVQAVYPIGFEKLSKEVQEILLKNSSPIKNFQSYIKQEINYANRSFEKREGFYWADNLGRFRAEFSQPKESVVFDSKKLYFFIPENKFTWVIDPNNNSQNIRTNKSPLVKDKFWSDRKATIKPVNSWFQSLNSSHYKFTLRLADGNSWLVEVDLKLKAITKRTLSNKHGQQIMIEKLSDPIFFKQSVFFTSINVKVINPVSKMSITNNTHYSQVVFNLEIGPTMFIKPKGKLKKYTPHK